MTDLRNMCKFDFKTHSHNRTLLLSTPTSLASFSVIIQTLSMDDLMAPTGVTRRLTSGIRTIETKFEYIHPVWNLYLGGIDPGNVSSRGTSYPTLNQLG